MDEESSIDKLRRIVSWADWQDEFYFDNLSVEDIITLFELVTEKVGVDMISDVDETDMYYGNIQQILNKKRKTTPNKKLDVQACKMFVCPNLSLLDIKGAELGLSINTVTKSKEIATEYLKATYHKPKYGSIKSVLPVFTYIAAALCGEKTTQNKVVNAYDANGVTFRKWYLDVTDVLGYDKELLRYNRVIKY